MLSLTHQFAAWCRSKPADEEYDYIDAKNCALAQFARSIGMAGEDEYVTLDRFPHEFNPLVFGEKGKGDWTFGSLADRVERRLAEQVRP